jgi:hypothetical protein
MESLLGWAQNEQAQAADKRNAEHAQLQNALEGAQTPEERNTILQNARTKNPSGFKQFIENGVRRLTGQGAQPAPALFTGPAPSTTTQTGAITNPETGEQISAGTPQTVQGPAPKLKTRDEAMAQFAARGVNPDQQQANFARAQLAPDKVAQVNAVKSALQAAGVTDPAVIQRAVEAVVGVKQPTRYENEQAEYESAVNGGYQGSFDQWQSEQRAKGTASGKPQKLLVKTKYGKLTPALVQNGKYVSPTGEPLEGAEPFVKPPTPPPAISQYVDLMGKKILADNGQGPALTNEQNAQLQAAGMGLTLAAKARADEMAAAQAQWNLAQFTSDEGSVELQTKADLANRLRGGERILGPTVGAPTGQDKTHSMLATSAIAQVDRMQRILREDPRLTGPGAGQLTQLQMFLGAQDPDAQQFLISSLLGSEHGVAVFGGRNIHTINDLQRALGDMKTNPKALSAALDVVKETMQPWATAGGRLPAPKKKAEGDGKGRIKVKLSDGRKGTIDAGDFDPKTMTKVQ